MRPPPCSATTMAKPVAPARASAAAAMAVGRPQRESRQRPLDGSGPYPTLAVPGGTRNLGPSGRHDDSSTHAARDPDPGGRRDSGGNHRSRVPEKPTRFMHPHLRSCACPEPPTAMPPLFPSIIIRVCCLNCLKNHTSMYRWNDSPKKKTYGSNDSR